MNEKMARLRDSAKNYWGAMGKKQKIWLGATIGVLLLTIILLTSILTKTQYETVFKDLDSTDAQAIMNYLDSSSISYRLGDGGNSISVPSSEADRVRVAAGSQGLVQNGSIGFAAFNTGSSQFGMTDNEFNVKYRSALNGEIQQLLNGMQGVASSKVVVNLPKESVFAQTEEASGASASIVMKFKPGFRPSQDEIDGYFNLVKTSVPNLKIADITITSPQGELTASSKIGGTLNNSGSANSQFQIQKKYESDLKRNIEQFLGTMVGGDNLAVSVLSSLNFDQVSREESLVKPLDNNNNNGLVISQQQSSESSEGTEGNAGGVAGTGETDVPGYSSTSSGGSSTAEKTSSTTNYEPNRYKNTIIGGPYSVKDLSISVGIPTSLLNQETKDQITQYLTSFVRSQLVESGQDVSNDALIAKKVSVIGQNFAAAGASASGKGLTAGWIAAIAVAAAALIGGIVLAVRRRRAKEEEIIEEMAPRVEYPSINLESVTNENQVRKNLETLAKRKPDDFVNLLRTWLVEE
ncbi:MULTISPECIES: flagellar basal-body MS-ring/collar protein FliF [Paenibacillus]|uniref:flagellar basal-body MS-ring/collar protein FliF n=1 Tax=Paenibacillus TaxID=44249 RepID=UPI00061F4E4D|nr:MULTISPECIES: flagellar basal-body MS-ring/collar protein FliF [Paenibacillus]KKC46768.1 flagellar M-ring protein FliF [Paenibacillus sp. D9]